MAQAITISISAIAKRINATPQAVKNHLEKLNIEPIGFADLKKTRPLYSGNVIKKMKGCKIRKKPAAKPVIKSVRFSDKQWSEIQDYIKKTGFTFTQIIQSGITKAKKLETKIVHTYTVDPVFTRQVAMVGNNLNQIAKALNKANRYGKASPELVTACYATLADIDEQINGLSDRLQYDT